jgi:hypothetical protein
MTEEKQISAAPPSEQQDAQAPPVILDKRKLPEGVVPKQAQGYVMAGLAVLILLAVMFSKDHAKPAPKETPLPALSASTDMNQRKIQELEQNLSADQRQMQQQRAGAALSPAGVANTANPTQPGTAPQPGSAAQFTQAPLTTPTQSAEHSRDPVADAEKAMAFKARFASNLVSGNDGGAHVPTVASDSSRPFRLHGNRSAGSQPCLPRSIHFAAGSCARAIAHRVRSTCRVRMLRPHAKRRSSARWLFATSLLCPPMVPSSMPATSPGLENSMWKQSTFWPEEHLASLSPSPVSERDWMTRVATSPSSLLDLLIDSGPYGWCGRTCPVSCQSTTDGRLEPSSGCWSNAGMGSPTEFLTLSFSEYPSDGAASSLSDILETGELPRQFYLSGRACRGILRRAGKRGKTLPPLLAHALMAVAGQEQTSISTTA